MSINVKKSLFWIFFLLTAPVIGADSSPIKIGVEIETSSIKTDIKLEQSDVGFIVSEKHKGRIKGKELWAIEADTLDRFFEREDKKWEGFSTNLEVKTIGGFESREFFFPNPDLRVEM